MTDAPTEAIATAPGRINLMGDHTDYNDGFVLPLAIPQQTTVTLRRRAGTGFVLHAHDLSKTVEFTIDQTPPDHFACYVYGCLREAADAGVRLPALSIDVSSDVPMGVGLSSSAALEVAMLRALRDLTGSDWSDVLIAQMAQRAEVDYAGVRCGIMDQMASSLAGTTRALWLDTRTLQRQLVPLPEGSEVLVLHSGVERSLACSGYNTRRAECEQAAHLLGVSSLRDLVDATAAWQLPDPLRRRVRHVLCENARVLAALKADASQFGALMDESHASLRDDYEVSHPHVDQLVALLVKHSDVFGARMTGGGFGGACVALCKSGTAHAVAAHVLERYGSEHPQARMLVPWAA